MPHRGMRSLKVEMSAMCVCMAAVVRPSSDMDEPGRGKGKAGRVLEGLEEAPCHLIALELLSATGNVS